MKPNVIGAALLLGLTGVAQAQPQDARFDYGVGLRVEADDNVLLDPDEPIDDILIAPFLGFILNRNGSRIDANIAGYAEYVTYQDDTFRSEVRSTLDADVTWRVVENRFHWIVQNGRARSPINITAQDSPDNLQETNSFATGPDVLFRLGPADTLTIGARYTDFRSSENNAADSNGASARATWLRNISSTRSFGAFADFSTREFDVFNALTPDYDRQQVSLTFDDVRNIGGARDTFSINLGYSQVQFDGSLRDDLDTPTARFGWDRESPDGSVWNFALVREIGNVFDDTAAFTGADNASVIRQTAVAPDPFTRNLFQAAWTKPISDRFTSRLEAIYDSQDYDALALDQDRIQLGAELTARLRPLWELRARASWIDQDFTQIDQQDERMFGSLILQYQRTRRLLFELEARYSEQDSTNPLLGFHNRVLMARVTYVRG